MTGPLRPSAVRLGLGAAAATAVLACAGCAAGSPGAQVAPPGSSTGPSTSAQASTQPISTTTAAQNRAATRKEAARLLLLARLPSGITPISGPQRKLSGPSMGIPQGSSLVDRHRFWRTMMSMATVFAYLKAHPPAGLVLSGTGSGGTVTGGITSEEIGWGEPDRAYAQGLQLEVGLAMVRGGTIIRADGVGEWIDPRPVRDIASGPRLRVTVAGGCPPSDQGDVGVTNPGRGLDHALLPPGRPSSALICVYGGLNAKARLNLARHVAVPVGGAARLSRQALRIQLGHTDGGTFSCPLDDGSIDVVAFHYAAGPDVDLWYHATGCEDVANGHILAAGGLDLTPYLKSAGAG